MDLRVPRNLSLFFFFYVLILKIEKESWVIYDLNGYDKEGTTFK